MVVRTAVMVMSVMSVMGFLPLFSRFYVFRSIAFVVLRQNLAVGAVLFVADRKRKIEQACNKTRQNCNLPQRGHKGDAEWRSCRVTANSAILQDYTQDDYTQDDHNEDKGRKT
jgi:hypothetical protein